MIPDITAETCVGAAGCASGSQMWRGMKPAFTPKPTIARRKMALAPVAVRAPPAPNESKSSVPCEPSSTGAEAAKPAAQPRTAPQDPMAPEYRERADASAATPVMTRTTTETRNQAISDSLIESRTRPRVHAKHAARACYPAPPIIEQRKQPPVIGSARSRVEPPKLDL